MKHCIILGGGISGIASAYYLSRLVNSTNIKITLIEASKRLGGWIDTTCTSDGAVFDHGPRSLRGAGKVGYNSLALFEELGLSDNILPICRNNPAATKRYIYANGQLCLLPNSFAGIVKRKAPFSKSLLAHSWKEPFKAKAELNDDSVFNFFSRRFSDEVAQYISDPLCRGIFAGDARKLSMKACFLPVFKWEQENGSIVKGAIFGRKEKFTPPEGELIYRFKSERWAIWSLKKGLQQLVDVMEKELDKAQNVDVVKEAPCTDIQFVNNKVKVKCGDKTIEGDHIISAILGSTLGELVDKQHRLFAANLKSIPSVHCAVVHLEYKGNVFPELAFGHLIPSTEPTKALGMIYTSSIFPQHNKEGDETTRFTCMLGGAWFRDNFGDPDTCDIRTIEAEAIKAGREQLNIKEEPIRVITRIHKNCIPQYLVGHADVVDSLQSYIDKNRLPLSLLGASYRGVSVNDCIYNAKIEAEKLATTLI